MVTVAYNSGPVVTGQLYLNLWDFTDPQRPAFLGSYAEGFPRSAGAGNGLVAISPDGGTAVAAYHGRLEVWDLAERTAPAVEGSVALPPQEPGGPAGAADPLGAVALSPDGRVLAVADGGGVSLWSLADPQRPVSLGGELTDPEGAGFQTLAFGGPGDDWLYAGSAAGGVASWDLNADQAITDVCAEAGNVITAGEWGAVIPGTPYSPPCR